MTVTTEYDALTNRKYIVIDKDNLANYKYELLSLYKGELRFLNEEGTLVKVRGDNQVHSPNVLEFYLNMWHTHLKLECINCDNQGPHSFFYEYEGPIKKHQELHPIYNVGNSGSGPEPLKLYLNDTQADTVFKVISRLTNLAAEGGYKFLPIMHNCAALLTDTYKQSGFPGHFSDYHTDSELLHDLVEGKSGFIHKRYYPDYEEIVHPFRAEINKFIKSMYGDSYGTNWKFCFDEKNCASLGISSSGLQNTPIDHQKAALNPIISNIVREAMHTREKIIPKLVEIGLSVWDGYHNFPPILIQNYIDELIHAPITYGNLHYTYLLPHMLNIAIMFKDELYAREVVNIFAGAEEGALVSNYYIPLNETPNLLEYYKQCDASYREIWGDPNQY